MITRPFVSLSMSAPQKTPLAIILFWLATLLPVPAAFAEKRLALVVGNSAYQHIGKLKNARNDASLMTKTLGSLNFEVVSSLDADFREMRSAIRRFYTRLSELGSETIALIYFAGHGVQVDGENYLLPVDANIENEGDVSIEAIKAGEVLAGLDRLNPRLSIVILDACRNNPYRGFKRSAPRGLAKMDAPRGTYIIFSTAPGEVADDGTTDNSPFTQSLSRHITLPDLTVEAVVKNVGRDVDQVTMGRQQPWISSSVYQDFFLAGRTAPVTPSSQAPAWVHTRTPSELGLPAGLDLSALAADAWGKTPSSAYWALHDARIPAAWVVLRRFRMKNPDAPRPVLAVLAPDWAPSTDLKYLTPTGHSRAGAIAFGTHVSSVAAATFGNGLGVEGAYPGAAVVPIDTLASKRVPAPSASEEEMYFDLFYGALVNAQDAARAFASRDNPVRTLLVPLSYNWAFRQNPNPTSGSTKLLIEAHGRIAGNIAAILGEKVLIVQSGAIQGTVQQVDVGSPFELARTLEKNSNILVVDGSDRNGGRATFSGLGGDVSAPAVEILGLGKGDVPVTQAGTGHAAALAAAVSLMVFETNPSLTAMEVAELIRRTADPSPGRSPKLNALAAILEATRSHPEYLIDVNEDGVVDKRDIEAFHVHAKQYAANDPGSPFGWRLADFNGDGKVDAADIEAFRNLWPGGRDSFDAAAAKIGLLQ